MALPMWQPSQIPSNNVVADPTGSSTHSRTPSWLGYYGRSAVSTPQSRIDDHNDRVKRESEHCTPPWLR